MRFHLTRASGNRKTGPIPVSTTSKDSCPDSCPLKASGCYAKSGPLGMHWTQVSKGTRGVEFNEFLSQVKSLPHGQLWRHNQAGDLPGDGDTINPSQLSALVAANKNKKGFTYTHKPLTSENAGMIRSANQKGFTINLSANNVVEADRLFASKVGPVVCILPADTATPYVTTPQGNRVVVCPAQRKENISCATCGMCAKSDRKTIIGFLAHGVSHKKVSKLASLPIIE